MIHALLIVTFSVLLGIVLSSRIVSAKDPVTRPSAVDSVNALACDLYAKLAAEHADANVFFSPFSMSCALAMTAEGARGQTADEMRRTLHASELAALHRGLGELSDRLGPKQVPQELRDRISAMRAELFVVNKTLEATRSWDESVDKLNQKAEQLAADLNKLLAQVDQYEFRAANALWGERSFNFERPYLDTIAKFYKTGGLFPVDFRGDPNGSRVRINDWVSKQTNDRIKDLLKPEHVPPDTRLILTNAVYFKGEWSDPFDAQQTQVEDFTAARGNKLRVPLMHKWNPEGAKYAAFNGDGSLFATPEMVSAREAEADRAKHYPAADGFLVAELSYKGGDIAMTVIVPQSSDGLKDVRGKLSAENVAAWTRELRERKLEIFLPKFKLETEYEMDKPLKSLGMNRAFVDPADPNGAEFDGISASADPQQRLFIGAVVHKAFVDVNEKGTEAAAATGVATRAGAAAPRQVPFIPTVRVDRPFIFLIRETGTGTILFMGQVTAPT